MISKNNKYPSVKKVTDEERIGIVINKEALSVDRANFLATHVPMRRIVDELAPRPLQATSESGLLAELKRKAAADEHVFAVVKGMPGTGKSHLIRWLREQYASAHPQETVLLIARAKGIDIRAQGSGNIGATNVLRVVGRKYGILCLVLDLLKGCLLYTSPSPRDRTRARKPSSA